MYRAQLPTNFHGRPPPPQYIYIPFSPVSATFIPKDDICSNREGKTCLCNQPFLTHSVFTKPQLFISVLTTSQSLH